MSLLEEISIFVLDDSERVALHDSRLSNSDDLLDTLILLKQAPGETLENLHVQTGIPSEKLRDLLGLYDLCGLEGLGPKRAELLYHCGIYLPEHLLQQDAAALHQRLVSCAHHHGVSLRSVPSVRQIRTWQWKTSQTFSAQPPEPVQPKESVEPAAICRDETSAKLAPKSLLDDPLVETSRRSRETVKYLGGYSLLMVSVATVLFVIREATMDAALFIKIANTVSFVVGAGGSIAAVVLLGISFFIVQAILTNKYSRCVVSRLLSPEEMRRYVDSYKIGLALGDKLKNAESWWFLAILVLMLLAIGATLFSPAGIDVWKMSASPSMWLTLPLFGWLLLLLTFYERTVISRSAIQEAGEFGQATALRILGFALHVIWALSFLVILTYALPIIATFFMRLSNYAFFVVARFWQDEIIRYNPSHFFFLFNAEDSARLTELAHNAIVYPGMILILLYSGIFVIMLQPLRAFAYLSLVVGGSLLFECLSQHGMEPWSSSLPPAANWGLKILVLLLVGYVLDLLFGQVSRRIRPTSSAPMLSVLATDRLFWALTTTGVTVILLGGAASFGVIPWIQQPTAHDKQLRLPTSAQQDDFGIWMSYVDSAAEYPVLSHAQNSHPTNAVKSFWMDITEVTNAQFEQCVTDGRCQAPLGYDSFQRLTYYGNRAFVNYPVVQVTMEQARTFCKWRGGRLPTESEWLVAGQGLDGRTYPWGNQADPVGKLNFCTENRCATWTMSDDGIWRDTKGHTLLDLDLWSFTMDVPAFNSDGYNDTSPVGAFPLGQSPFGMLDMVGNVAEWTELGVLRGGSFLHGLEENSLQWSDDRYVASVDRSFANVGFRCVRDKMPVHNR